MDAVTVPPGNLSFATVPNLGFPLSTTLPKIPGFHIEEELGRGGMGVVYLARQLRLNRLVALKMIKGADQADASTRIRFLAEAEAIAKLHHPGIVQVFEFGTHENNPYFAMEYVSGGSLDKKLAGHPLPPREAAAFVEQLTGAVQSAHDAGIIHRDLKPANILLSSDSVALSPEKKGRLHSTYDSAFKSHSKDTGISATQPKITDFGLVKNVGSDMTASGVILGTPSYMAPEQADGNIAVSTQVDIYALGAVLYECLTGRAPFKAATPLETLMQVINEEPVSVRHLQAKTPTDLETICHKCLQKDPAKRYASATELGDDLGRFLRNEPISARPIGRMERMWRWCKRYPAVAALVVILLAGLFLFAAKNRELAHANLKEGESRELAEKRFRQTRTAVDQFFTDISESPELLKKEPGTQALRRTLLTKAQSYYEQFLAERSQDPTMLLEAAEASNRLIRILEELNPGSPVLEEQINKALAIRTRLLEQDPTDPDRLYDLSYLDAQRGRWLLLRDRVPEALTLAQSALDRLTPLIAAHPDREKYKLLQSSILISAAQMNTRLSKHREAFVMYSQAEPITTAFHAAYPDSIKYANELGRLYSSIGYTKLQIGLGEEALPYFTKAAKLFDVIRQTHPKDRDATIDGGMVYGNLGVIHKQANRQDEALLAFKKVVEIYEPMHRDNPQVVDFANGLAMGLGSIARIEMDRNHRDDALVAFQRVLRIFEQLQKENPGVVRYAESVALTYNNMAQVQLKAGKYQEAFNFVVNAFNIAEPLHRANPSARNLASMVVDSQRMQGRIYFLRRQWAEAFAMLTQSIALSKQVVQAYPKVPAFSQSLADSYLLMQRVLMKQNKTTEAQSAHDLGIAVLNKQVSENPKNLGLTHALARSLLDAPSIQAAVWERSIKLMEQLTQQQDDDDAYWATLGYGYYQAGKYGQAKAALLRSQHIEITAHNAFYLAMTLWKLGETKQAQNSLDQAVKLAEQRPDDDRLVLLQEQAEQVLGVNR